MEKISHYYTRFEENGIYHIYNRTVDKKPMFSSNENYIFFIRQFDKYLSDYLKIYAYCLLGNHFHFMVKINDMTELNTFRKLSKLNKHSQKLEQKSTHDIVSHQFRKFFQSYAMAFNKQQNRIGTLFQTPFKRVRIQDEKYLKDLTCYINTNAEKHDLVDNFRLWKWSSYQNTISNNNSKLLKEELITNYFGTIDNFIYCHSEYSKRTKTSENDFYIED